MIRLLLSLLLTSLAGCVLGPNYDRPIIDLPESYHYEVKEAKDRLNLAWWKLFDDPILDCLIEEALLYNKNVKIAAANIENAMGILMQTRAPLFPQIGYQGSYDRFRTSQTLASSQPTALIPNPQTVWQALLTGSWQLDIWGRTRRLTEAARAQLFATHEARQAVILSLVTSVANSYFQLRGLDEQLVISIRTMDSYKEAVDYFQKQFDHGQTSLMTVEQAKTQYEGASAKIPQIKSQIVEVENALSLLLGKNPGSIPRGKSINELKLPDVPCGIPSELLNRLPTILEAEQNLVAANAQIGAARALYFPTISLTGEYGGASQELKNLFKGPSRSWSFLGSIVGPLFTAGQIRGQEIAAEATRKAALYGYQNAILNGFSEVETALYSHTMLIDGLASLTRLVAASGEYVRLANLQYNGGYSPYFVVIQADGQYFPAQLSQAETRTDLLISIVNIYQALGGGWVYVAEGMTQGCP